jgi:hypothetical protein
MTKKKFKPNPACVQEFQKLLQENLTPEEITQAGYTNAEELAEEIAREHSEFSKIGTLQTLKTYFMPEVPYLKAYGMTALAAGYCGKAKTNAHLKFVQP